jgi:hypothetical protein
MLRHIIAAAFFACAPCSLHAASLVIGGASLATTEGSTGSNSGGFIGSSNFTLQYQILSTDLAAQGLTVGSTITGVRARLHEGTVMTGDRTINDFEITLAQAANVFGSMSTSYASNMLSPMLVRDGSITFLDAQMPEGSIPNAFGQLVSFSTPYVYTGGDLIFMYSRLAVTGGGAVTTDSHDGGGVVVQRLVANSFHASSGTLGTTFSVLQLEFNSVPEPSRTMLLLLSGCGLLLSRRRPAGV